MKLELDKEDLISLVMGKVPNYAAMVKCGDLGWGSDNRGWQWYESKLKELSEEELYDLYLLCKNSWEKN